MRRQILAISFVLITQAVRAGPPSAIEYRLRQIAIKSCEAVSFSNIVRVIPTNLLRHVDVKRELVELPDASMITARVLKTRLILIPDGLPHQMDTGPIVGSWTRPKHEEVAEFLYLSDSSCSNLMRAKTRFVVSTENAGCDSAFTSGWCIVDSSRQVRDVRDALKRYTQRQPRH